MINASVVLTVIVGNLILLFVLPDSIRRIIMRQEHRDVSAFDCLLSESRVLIICASRPAHPDLLQSQRLLTLLLIRREPFLVTRLDAAADFEPTITNQPDGTNPAMIHAQVLYFFLNKLGTDYFFVFDSRNFSSFNFYVGLTTKACR